MGSLGITAVFMGPCRDRRLDDWIALNQGGTLFPVLDRGNPATELEDMIGVHPVYVKASHGPFPYGAYANRGIRAVMERGHAIVVKTDADCILCHNLLVEIHRRLDSLRGPYAIVPDYMDIGLDGSTVCNRSCGTVAMQATSWADLRGYDERMAGYGREDGDLMDRAEEMGLTILRGSRMVYHMPHGDGPDRAARRWDATNIPVRRAENMAAAAGTRWQDCPESAEWGMQ